MNVALIFHRLVLTCFLCPLITELFNIPSIIFLSVDFKFHLPKCEGVLFKHRSSL